VDSKDHQGDEHLTASLSPWGDAGHDSRLSRVGPEGSWEKGLRGLDDLWLSTVHPFYLHHIAILRRPR